MTGKEFEALERGDIIRHVNEADSYVVTEKHVSHCSHDEGRVTFTIVRTSGASNPEEWTKVR